MAIPNFGDKGFPAYISSVLLALEERLMARRMRLIAELTELEKELGLPSSLKSRGERRRDG